jgi:hypothetical protein
VTALHAGEHVVFETGGGYGDRRGAIRRQWRRMWRMGRSVERGAEAYGVDRRPE